MKTLFILRGLPGAGKTLLANTLVSNATDAVAFSADDYFMSNGEYKFNPRKLDDAHVFCKENVAQAMYEGRQLIIVHNTNTMESELLPYMELAKHYGYITHSIIVENRANTINTHGVPADTLNKMNNRFNVKLV